MYHSLHVYLKEKTPQPPPPPKPPTPILAALNIGNKYIGNINIYAPLNYAESALKSASTATGKSNRSGRRFSEN